MSKPQQITLPGALDVRRNHLPIGPGTVYNNMLYTYGMISIDPKTGEIIGDTVQEQTKVVLDNLRIVAESAGTSFDNIVMVHIFLADIRADYDAFNEAFAAYFPVPPTRYCVGATIAFPAAKVEFQMIIAMPDA